MKTSASSSRPEVVDLIVVGGGIAGLTAAVVARACGCSVMLLEKADQLGGTSATSGGAAWLPGNRHVPAETDPEAPMTYLAHLLGERMDKAKIRAWLDSGIEAVNFLEARSSVRFRMYGGADYRTDVPGAGFNGRTIYPFPFDDRELGDAYKLIKAPLPAITVFHGMQTDSTDLAMLSNALRSPRAFIYSTRRLFKHYADLLVHGRSTRRQRGNALIGMLLKSAIDSGVQIRVNAPLVRVLVENGQVRGAVFEEQGQHREVRAASVVLASGGFSANASMRAEHTAFAAQHIGLPPETNVGDGLREGIRLGGRMGADNHSDYCHAPVSTMRKKNGDILKHPHFRLDRCKPGAIVVNAAGKRFVNEACSYHDFVRAMHANGAVPAFLIGDHRFLRKYGMGLVRPFPFPYGSFIRAGYLIEAPSIEALAQRLNIDGVALRDSVERLNGYARTGIDLEFGKGADVYSRGDGDPEHGPNPCLGEISQGPFYAVRVYPGDSSTTCGLVTDTDARVLDANDKPIEGLYACGVDMNNPSLGAHPAAGCNLGPAIAFAYRAARHVAARKDGALPTVKVGAAAEVPTAIAA
ncbi:FAD-dependent oxidoreductase [Variovorax sp. Sphag1AA]|uniref:FAD-dependent oxidoreductase n=1 Tax=Variovorax sp. Sphag1AA TaxID=2587027 RepID=UPI0016092223|nr:FAD-dependent oxidoreductase [Variovorax sp. Sphag1AA]MBB3177989.1 succinate dehydrogenase/fumarate reductase flavoprotein subunit [Variovorax sp. Sphag1AA]